MTKDEALKLALEWYDSGDENRREFIKMIKTITAVEEALAQPQQESVTRISVQDALPKVVQGVSYNARLTDEWCDHSWSYEGHSHNDSFYVCTHCKKEEWR